VKTQQSLADAAPDSVTDEADKLSVLTNHPSVTSALAFMLSVASLEDIGFRFSNASTGRANPPAALAPQPTLYANLCYISSKIACTEGGNFIISDLVW